MPRPKRLLLIPDVHAPYHDSKAFRCLLRVAKGWEPDSAVVLGDFADFCAVSSHPKDPKRLLPFHQEVQGVNRALDLLDKALGGCQDKQYLQGNHETRLERYVADKCPELYGTTRPWDELLRLDARGWAITPYKQSIQYGDLRITHDIGRAGVNAARQSVLDLGHSLAFGHTHRLQVHYQGTIGGPRHVGVTCGWLGDPLAIDYRHRDCVMRDSVHGFATVHLLSNGHFWLQAVPIIEGRCIVDGRVY